MNNKVIDIVAPSSGGPIDAVKKSAEYFENLGYRIRIPENLLSDDVPYCANSDAIRFDHLKNAIYAEDSKVIFCLRGGYGSARLLDMLQEITPPDKAKILVGFSDITALHLFLNKSWGWQSIHGPVFTQIGKYSNELFVKKLVSLIEDKHASVKLNLDPINKSANDFTINNCKVIGGNLTIIECSIGTSWEIDAENKVLILEDVGEKGYALDRSFLHLKQSGILDNVKAVILGDFTLHKEEDGANLEYALNSFAEDMNNNGIPVYRCSGIGHGDINYPFIEGGYVSINEDYSAEFGWLL
jgi:muramoyltetrapeptide carboxypeptidase